MVPFHSCHIYGIYSLPWVSEYPGEGETTGRRKLCIMPYYSYHIYGAWRSI